MKTARTEQTMSLNNRADLYTTLGVGLIVAIITVVTTTLRIISIVPNENVPVLVPLAETTADLPIGPNEGPVSAEIGRAHV